MQSGLRRTTFVRLVKPPGCARPAEMVESVDGSVCTVLVPLLAVTQPARAWMRSPEARTSYP